MPHGPASGGGLNARQQANLVLAQEVGFDAFWIAALEAVQDRYSAGDVVLAPIEFLHFFAKTYPIHLRRRMIAGERIDWFLLHKGMRDRVDPAIAKEALGLHAHFANEVFVLFGRREATLPKEQKVHLAPILSWTDACPEEEQGLHAALLKTFNRPSFLERCLASVAGQFDRVLVVDVGSVVARRNRNAAATRRAGAGYIALDGNRGAACAFNVGLSALLAELEIAWISAFDDDVELAADGVERLLRVTRALGPIARLNLYSGYASPHHRAHREDVIGGEPVLVCRSCSGQHMHAHRSYWEAVIPIPTAYARAPKKAGGVFAGQGDDTDWWCSNWAPRSAIKRGASVYVLPGLATTFGQGRSTWGGPGA